MSISFPRTFPTHKGIAGLTLRERKVAGIAEAPGSLVQQVYEWPGERWEGEFTLPPMRRENADPWLAWLSSLRGAVGSFLMGDPSRTRPRGLAFWTAGTPQVDGAQSARVRTLAIKTGLSGARAGWLKANSYLSLGTGSSRRLHKVLVDVDLDASGKATAEIWPALRAAVADNDTVYITDTTGKFMLAQSTVEQAIDNARIMRPARVAFVEDLR